MAEWPLKWTGGGGGGFNSGVNGLSRDEVLGSHSGCGCDSSFLGHTCVDL